MPEKNTPVVVGISGGVDSSIAAWQLKEWGPRSHRTVHEELGGRRRRILLCRS